MDDKLIKIKVKKENILSEVLKENLSKRFYRHLKYICAEVKVNGIEKKWYEKVSTRDCIEIRYKESEKEYVWPVSDELPEILFENEHYLIINKKGGILTIPTRGNPCSLYQQIVSYLKANTVHILNRLDKETSGLVLVAKDRYAASLLEPTHKHIVRKYLCLVEGIVEKDGIIQNYIAKSDQSNQRFIGTKENGKLAISSYRVLKRFAEHSLLEFTLQTGRTHQIRLHTSSMGHPIVGDYLYGNSEGELCLTSYYLEFKDPFTNEIIQKQIKEAWSYGGRAKEEI
ncbi:MAG: RluA family pseudouridine synthase [Anaeroplasmataceae bacterium]|nr:RluA family pseudouridine synthase [Anaeroplasmataceae bacterium]